MLNDIFQTQFNHCNYKLKSVEVNDIWTAQDFPCQSSVLEKGLMKFYHLLINWWLLTDSRRQELLYVVIKAVASMDIFQRATMDISKLMVKQMALAKLSVSQNRKSWIWGKILQGRRKAHRDRNERRHVKSINK